MPVTAEALPPSRYNELVRTLGGTHPDSPEESSRILSPMAVRLSRRRGASPVRDRPHADPALVHESRAVAIRRASAADDALPHFGVVRDNYTVLLSGADTGGAYALIDMYVSPGGGPPPHRHDFEEMFHVVEGQLEGSFEGESFTLHPGDMVNVPASAPHFFRNVTDEPARVLCMVTPPGLEDYFAAWATVLPSRTVLPDPTPEEIHALHARAAELGPAFRIEDVAVFE